MNKLLVSIFILVIVGGFFLFWLRQKEEKQSIPHVVSQEKTVPSKNQKQYSISSPTLFVPYWTLGEEEIDSAGFENVLYFGLAANENGIDRKDQGYKNISSFLQNTSKPSLLVVRMTDSKTNFKILENKKVQEEIISEATRIAKENGFTGVVLDLEVSSLPFGSIVSQISNFVSEFSKKAHRENLSFSITVFGDTFSSIRPYDISYLAKVSDAVFIMSYDFHKATRTPGPNFPFSGKEKYGYDFKTMVTDFLQVIPTEKIIVVFGMFGYDWILNEDGENTGIAEPLSLLEIEKKFISDCVFLECKITKDPETLEKSIAYIDIEGNNHSVWFEDKESIEKKKAFLKEKGINNYAFWAYSFF